MVKKWAKGCVIQYITLTVLLSHCRVIQSWPKKCILGCVIPPASAVVSSRNLGQTFLVSTGVKCLIATYSVFLVLKKARRKQREEERENVCKDWLY